MKKKRRAECRKVVNSLVQAQMTKKWLSIESFCFQCLLSVSAFSIYFQCLLSVSTFSVYVQCLLSVVVVAVVAGRG